MKKFFIFLLIFILVAAAGPAYYWLVYKSGGDDNVISNGTIFLGDEYESLDPFSPVAIDKQYLHPIYESLVDFDDQFALSPALAFSYGKLSETSWQFKLRSDVKFHDQTPLTAQLVIAEFNYLKQANFDHLKDLIENIVSVEAVDSETIVFSLQQADPEFPAKITQIPIIATLNTADLLKSPNGTGPYEVVAVTSTEVNYRAFADYWNKDAIKLKSFTYKSVLDKDRRLELALEDAANTLAMVPFPVDFEEKLSGTSFILGSQPDLTVNFFIWNALDDFWQQPKNREHLRDVFPYELISVLTSGQGTPAGQFVSRGVLGFTPDLEPQLDSFEVRKSKMKEYGFEGRLIRFAVPTTIKVFGLQLEKELNALGFEAEAYAVEPAQIFDPYWVEGVNLLFLGWQSDLGTIGNFLTTFFNPESQFNVGKYQNRRVKELIRQFALAQETTERLKILQEMVQIISISDPYGLPLFYGRLPYLYRKDIDFNLRSDGIILVEKIQATNS